MLSEIDVKSISTMFAFGIAKWFFGLKLSTGTVWAAILDIEISCYFNQPEIFMLMLVIKGNLSL